MQIPFNQFEQYISDTILKRGLSYFKNGRVQEPAEIRPGEYEAIVEGSVDYTVRLTIKKGIITGFVCDCPYDMGPVCKHVAAVIFYLQQVELDLKTKKKSKKSSEPAKKVKRKTIAEQVNELLEKATNEELKEFIRGNSVENRTFRNLFLSSFTQYNTDESKGFYVTQVKSILKSAADRYGFIDWRASGHVGSLVGNLLDSAQKQMDNNNFKSAIFIITAVMEEMTEALQYADDSNGDIGLCINTAGEMLYQMAEGQEDEQVRSQIIGYCFKAFEKKIYEGWDTHIFILRIAAMLLKTGEEKERIFSLIDKADRSDYEREEAQKIKYEVLVKTGEEEVASKYLEENLSNPGMRRKALEKALADKNYDRAIEIARDGVEHDMKDKPGLAKGWYEWLLRIAQAQNDGNKIIEYARYLLIDNFRNEQDYYRILKERVKPEEWTSFIEGVIQDIEADKQWRNKGLVARIFIREELWDRLLELVKKSPDLNTVESYEKYLCPHYPDEIADLYAAGILSYMKYNVGRKHYQRVCRYLRRIIKLGSREKVDDIITFLRKEYPTRKALLEELNYL